MTDTPATRRNPIRRALGKGRRGVRRAILGRSGTAGQTQLDELWAWVNGMQQTVNTTANRVDEAFRRMDRDTLEAAEHADLVIDQLWRRLEAADARIATQVQKLTETSARQIADMHDVTTRLRRENAAILRLLGHETETGHETARADEVSTAGDQAAASSLPIARMTLFSEIERGASEDLLQDLERYVPYFVDADGPILDIGCGKGDFLDLLRQAGNPAYGVDLDEDAVTTAVARGLDARLEDLFKHLEGLPNASLGGVFSSQVVEHLPAETIGPLYDELYRVVRSGARVIVETPNPATFATHVQSFWRDPTHIRPVPLPALDFTARSAGFVSEQTIYLHPSADSDRLEPIALEPKDPLFRELVERFNANVEKLNDLLYGYQDYAYIARKP